MAHARPVEYANLHASRTAVLQEMTEARAASERLGVPCVARAEDGCWRAVYRDGRDRAARLRTLAAEIGSVPGDRAARRRSRLAELDLDLQVDRLRARRARARDLRTLVHPPTSSPARLRDGVLYEYGSVRPRGRWIS